MITRRQIFALSGLAAIAVGLGACANNDDVGGGTRGVATELRGEASELDLPLNSTPGVAQAARGSADLGWALLSAGTDANRVIAPSSLAITLGMLAEGATDDTLASLDAAFGLSGNERSAALGALRQALKNYDSLPDSVDVNAPPEVPVVHQASQAVVVEGKSVEQLFLDRIATYFDVAATQVPLGGMKAVLDSWVRENTAGLIEKSAIKVVPELVLVLQDAILFAAAWRYEFPIDDAFLEFAGPGGSNRVDALAGTFNVAYGEGNGWQAVRLPYDDVLAMDVILPAVGVSPSALSSQELDDIRQGLDAAPNHKVALTMPPVDLTGKLELLPMLDAQGITFDNSVDGIFPDAIVDQFVQQVRFMVSAKGTVGAAVTEVAVVESAPAPTPEIKTMTVDRPFVMRVLDTRTGWPLFLAVISDAEAALPGAQ